MFFFSAAIVSLLVCAAKASLEQALPQGSCCTDHAFVADQDVKVGPVIIFLTCLSFFRQNEQRIDPPTEHLLPQPTPGSTYFPRSFHDRSAI
jgi:hypothetical protein